MKNYMDAVRAAGIGRTPQLCQDALIETLEELFVGKKYNGQQSRKELKIFKQDLPVPEDYDKWLTISYGDYMQLPPPEERVYRHDAVFIDLEHSYKQYKGIHYCVDEKKA